MTDTLQLILALVAVVLAGTGLATGDPRVRWLLMLGALVSAFALICGLAWDGPLADAREQPALLALTALVGLAVLLALAVLFDRHPEAVPLLAVVALPFRIPVELGGETSNLLIPLYLVIAASTVAVAARAVRSTDRATARLSNRPLDLVLGLALVLYGLQATYSDDITAAATTVAFFLAPFAVLYALLVRIEWSKALLVKCLVIITAEAVLFSLVGIVQAAVGEIFWNPALIASNDFHLYFRVNSLFWDPNIFGRYLALVLLLVTSSLVWIEGRSRSLAVALVIAFLWAGLLFAWSQSSFISLIVGLLVLVALRYSLRTSLLAAPFVIVALIAAVFFGAEREDSRGAAAAATSGRTSLVDGGLALAVDRPVGGWGSGSFSVAFAEREGLDPGQTSVSHNEVVTVAAEQGLAGLCVYALILVVAAWTLFGGTGSVAAGLGGSLPREGEARAVVQTRIALAAGFSLLFAHTMGYAGFLTDPLCWAVLAIAAALGGRLRRRP